MLQWHQRQPRPCSTRIHPLNVKEIRKYFVGPRVWVKAVRKNSYYGSGFGSGSGFGDKVGTAVAEGSVSIVNWQQSWRAMRGYRGSVSVDGPVASEPLLFGIYNLVPLGMNRGPEKPPAFIGGRRTNQIPLDDSGWYEIKEGDPLPGLIGVCIANDAPWAAVSGLHLIDVIAPGDHLDLDLGALELRWLDDGPDLDAIRVTYEVPIEGFSNSVRTHLNTCRVMWAKGSALKLHGVPLSVTSISIGGLPFPVDVTASAVAHYEISWEQLKTAGGR